MCKYPVSNQPGATPIATYIVINVRKAWSADRSHRHLEGVFVENGTYYTRQAVAESLDRGDVWISKADGMLATITPLPYCPQLSCLASPYIATRPSSSDKDNLENLEER